MPIKQVLKAAARPGKIWTEDIALWGRLFALQDGASALEQSGVGVG